MTVPPILPRLFKISNMKDWLILCLLITGTCLLAQVIPVGFMQKAVPLLVSTSQVTSITSTSASSGGNVTSDGGKSITAKGVVWSTSINPTIALTTKTNQGAGSGVFSSNLTGLAEVNKYYVRAYAQNSSAISYGDEISFWTSGPNGVTIGTQIWSNINFHGNIQHRPRSETDAWSNEATICLNPKTSCPSELRTANTSTPGLRNTSEALSSMSMVPAVSVSSTGSSHASTPPPPRSISSTTPAHSLPLSSRCVTHPKTEHTQRPQVWKSFEPAGYH